MLNGFKYWEAPDSEAKALFPGSRRCDLCGEEARCFDLARAIRPAGVGGSAGCVSCLRLGRFGFFHITTIGYLDEGGLTWYDEDAASEDSRVFAVDAIGTATAIQVERANTPAGKVPPEAVEELHRTPDFPTWNEVAWPFHCSDFMIYLGPWQPEDVRRAAKTKQREPADLFAEMVDAGDERLWVDNQNDWAFTFHAFRCTACESFRGSVDLD